jgi:hypothetical protein
MSLLQLLAWLSLSLGRQTLVPAAVQTSRAASTFVERFGRHNHIWQSQVRVRNVDMAMIFCGFRSLGHRRCGNPAHPEAYHSTATNCA